MGIGLTREEYEEEIASYEKAIAEKDAEIKELGDKLSCYVEALRIAIKSLGYNDPVTLGEIQVLINNNGGGGECGHIHTATYRNAVPPDHPNAKGQKKCTDCGKLLSEEE